MSDDDFREFEELARRAGSAVRAEALDADSRIGVPVEQHNRRTVWAAGALGLAAAAFIAIFVVTNTNDPKATVSVQHPSSLPATSATPSTALAPTTLPVPITGGEPAYPGCAWDGSEVVTLPVEFSPMCNALDQIAKDIAWTTWTRTEASGTGTLRWNSCASVCAQEAFAEAAAEFRFSDPAMYQGHFVFTKLFVDGAQLPEALQRRTYNLRQGLEPTPLADVDSWRESIDKGGEPVDLTDLQRMVDERQVTWRNNPYVMALQLGRIWFQSAGETFDIVETTRPNAPRRTFVITNATLGDDSVRAIRVMVDFIDGPEWRYDVASWSQQCHQGRGHQDFNTEPCL